MGYHIVGVLDQLFWASDALPLGVGSSKKQGPQKTHPALVKGHVFFQLSSMVRGTAYAYSRESSLYFGKR